MEEKVDRLFLEKNCPHCGSVRAELNMEAAYDAGFRGRDGQRFFVFSTLSNGATMEMLEKFGLSGKSVPVLVTWEGDVRTEPQLVLDWFRKNGMSTAG